MINYSKQAKLSTIKYNTIGFLNQNKNVLYLLLFLIVLSLLTGIFTGIKINNINNLANFDNYSFFTLISGDIYSVSIFIKRFLSAMLVMGLCIVFSLNKWLYVLGFLLVCYRAFLVSLNCTFIIIILGIGGAINSILILMPCQLLLLFTICFVFIVGIKAFKQKSLCGSLSDNFFKSVMLGTILIFTINIIESLLLITFKSTTLLII